MNSENKEQKCHILETEDLSKWLEMNQELKIVNTLYESSHLDIDIQMCTRCGQLYISCFLEIIDWSGGDDDCWNFWVPVSMEEAAAAKAHKLKVDDLIQSRRHITWHPFGKIYWNDGPEIAIIRGPG